MNTLFRFSISRLIKPMAVIFVARGHGLMAVIKPSNNAVSHGIVLLSNKFVRNSMQLSDQQPVNLLVDYLFEFLGFDNCIHESFICEIDFFISFYNKKGLP